MSFPSGLLRHCLILAGPTASGKSAAALLLAERIGAEIVSLDSMTVYRGMDIGTAKPSDAERQRVAHHLLDIADPWEDFSVAEYLRLVRQAADSILGKGRIPLFVGGTGLYLRALLRGFSAGPQADWQLRQQWQQDAVRNGPAWLHGELRRRDPAAAARLHPNDMRRLIRAIEVFELTGRPISEDQQQQPLPPALRPRLAVWLQPDRDWLGHRIDLRVQQMLADGWLQEARTLLELPQPPGRTASQALGYRELFQYLQIGGDLQAVSDGICTATRQFAKRQHTWFRSLTECQPLSVGPGSSAEIVAEQLLEKLADRPG
jgi:tRNA dimethylallyltransferase